MIKHPKIQKESATKICIHLHEMMALLLRFSGISYNMIKHPKIQTESATRIHIHLHEMMTLLLHFSGISENMIKHSKIQNELATKMCTRLHEMITLLLRFCRNIIKYDKTSENSKWAGLQNVHTSSRNTFFFKRFIMSSYAMWELHASTFWLNDFHYMLQPLITFSACSSSILR